MPFTPFHMGPAATFKACGGAAFSFMLFGYSQILIDIEALVHIYRNDFYLHGFPHSFLGATLIGIVALVTGKPICEGVLAFWGWCTKSNRNKQNSSQKMSWKGATVTVLSLGAGSRHWIPRTPTTTTTDAARATRMGGVLKTFQRRLT